MAFLICYVIFSMICLGFFLWAAKILEGEVTIGGAIGLLFCSLVPFGNIFWLLIAIAIIIYHYGSDIFDRKLF